MKLQNEIMRIRIRSDSHYFVKRFSKKITTSRAGGIEKGFSFKLMERSE